MAQIVNGHPTLLSEKTLWRGSGHLACLAAIAICGAGCSGDSNGGSDADDIGTIESALSPVVGNCSFSGGVLTVTSTASQNIVVTKRSSDAAVLVNNVQCSAGLTSTSLKRLVINGSGFDEVVILDFLGGNLAPGLPAPNPSGISVNMNGGNDRLSVSCPNSDDTYHVGSNAISFNTDDYRDIDFAGVESLSFSLAGGNDTFVATNPAAPTLTRGISGTPAIPITVYGGSGDDVLIGGSGADSLNGDSGDDVIEGGGLVANTANCGAGFDRAFSVAEQNPAVKTCEIRL